MSLQLDGKGGTIIIENEVLSKIAGMAATRCYGVVGMAGKKNKNGIVGLLMGDSITKGVKISTVDSKIVIDLHLMVEYGVNINAICQSIINNVKYSIESMTGCKVGKITVNVESTRVD